MSRAELQEPNRCQGPYKRWQLSWGWSSVCPKKPGIWPGPLWCLIEMLWFGIMCWWVTGLVMVLSKGGQRKGGRGCACILKSFLIGHPSFIVTAQPLERHIYSVLKSVKKPLKWQCCFTSGLVNMKELVQFWYEYILVLTSCAACFLLPISSIAFLGSFQNAPVGDVHRGAFDQLCHGNFHQRLHKLLFSFPSLSKRHLFLCTAGSKAQIQTWAQLGPNKIFAVFWDMRNTDSELFHNTMNGTVLSLPGDCWPETTSWCLQYESCSKGDSFWL